jgi:MarR family 2-MHQ and catechol resistance regulon transcriptional repressor
MTDDLPRAPAPDRRTAGALKLWVVLARAYGAVAERASRQVAAHGLTPAEFGVLEAIHHKGPMLVGELQRKLLVSSGGTTYLVDRLAERGLVERRACPGDRRARYAVLTGKGEQLIARIFPEHARVLAEAMAGLSEEKKRLATTLLRELGLHAASGNEDTAA